MSTLINSLKWRYATKKFDPSKKLTDKALKDILEAARLSASSYGLQPYKILVVTDPAIREELRAASWGQSQVTEASHLIVFANIKQPNDQLVDEYLENISQTREIPLANLQAYGRTMKSKIAALSPQEGANWTAKQTYIALGNLLAAAAEMKIDTCPMEGFENEAYNNILGLGDKGLNAAVVVAVGYRSAEDQTQFYKKVRQAEKELFVHL